MTCDGHRTRDKRIVCVGNTDEAATTTLQFLLFTREIHLVADPDKARFSEAKLAALTEQGIPLHLSRPERMEFPPPGEYGPTVVCLEDGTALACDLVFSLLGVRPNTQLAREMGLEIDDAGYVVIDEEGYTSLSGVFAAGDLTRMYTQQVSSAVHAGAEAAQTMNYYLYADYQKNTDEVAPQQEARGVPPGDR